MEDNQDWFCIQCITIKLQQLSQILDVYCQILVLSYLDKTALKLTKHKCKTARLILLILLSNTVLQLYTIESRTGENSDQKIFDF